MISPKMTRTYRKFSNSNRWFKRFYRHPKTFNEIRQTIENEDYVPTNREKARQNNLPTAWDDRVKSAAFEYYDIMTRVKYPRTYHLPWSEGISSDDRIITSLKQFESENVIVTEKMDGENTTMYSDYIHARSLDSRGGEDRAWVKNFWSSIRYKIPYGYRVCGENLWAKHSLSYDKLFSYFYGFGVWKENICLSWEETQLFFEEFGIVSVPVLYSGPWNEDIIRNLEKTMNFLHQEGYVVRVAREFSYNEFSTCVAKYVRKNHVTTDDHWRNSVIVPNKLQEITQNVY